MRRTRVKICGLTRADDLAAAVAAGADAIGLVFYPPSPRYIAPDQALALLRQVAPFVTLVGLFVDADPHFVREVLDRVPLDLLQFHGDESPDACSCYHRPWIKALRVRPGMDLLALERDYAAASGLLLDAYRPGVPGGTGESFDWQLIPPGLSKPVILAGGLSAANVAVAVSRVRPYAVDVSGGVESGKGVKDPEKIKAFIREVAAGDRITQ